MKLLRVMAGLFVCLLTGCESTPDSRPAIEAGDAQPSTTSFFARAACDPLDVLMALHGQFPNTRFHVTKVEEAVVNASSGRQSVELRFDSLEELEAGVRAPVGMLVLVSGVIDGREVGLNVSHGHMDVKAGPLKWQSRGKPRESARSFADGAAKAFSAAKVQGAAWHVTIEPQTAKTASELCARLNVNELNLFSVSAAGRKSPMGKVTPEGIASVNRPAVAEFRSRHLTVTLEFIEQDDSVLVFVETATADSFVAAAEAIENAK